MSLSAWNGGSRRPMSSSGGDLDQPVQQCHSCQHSDSPSQPTVRISHTYQLAPTRTPERPGHHHRTDDRQQQASDIRPPGRNPMASDKMRKRRRHAATRTGDSEHGLERTGGEPELLVSAETGGIGSERDSQRKPRQQEDTPSQQQHSYGRPDRASVSRLVPGHEQFGAGRGGLIVFCTCRCKTGSSRTTPRLRRQLPTTTTTNGLFSDSPDCYNYNRSGPSM